jgi:dTDP-4-dehydrorhamnose 3,5-epimerase-like enzyme
MNRLIQKIILPLIHDKRGDLVFAEAQNQIPFPIKRVFYITNVKSGGQRGFHAHKKTAIVLFCLKGSSLIKLDNGKQKAEILLDKPNVGVLIREKIWHSMEEFSPGTLLLVLASHFYDEKDYLRNYQEFKKYLCNQSLTPEPKTKK